jgi:hypothetical protein
MILVVNSILWLSQSLTVISIEVFGKTLAKLVSLLIVSVHPVIEVLVLILLCIFILVILVHLAKTFVVWLLVHTVLEMVLVLGHPVVLRHPVL